MNTILQSSGALLFFLLILCQCAQGAPGDAPMLVSSSFKKTGTTATLKAVWRVNNINPTDVANPQFSYKLTGAENYIATINGVPNAIPVPPQTGLSNITVTARVTGLTRSATYEWRTIAGTSNGITDVKEGLPEFTPQDSVPEIQGITAGAVTPTTAAITVQLIPNDNQDVNSTNTNSTVVEYGLDTAYGSASPAQSVPIVVHPNTGDNNAFDPAQLVLSLAGLQPGRTYHYRIKATNPDGDSFSADRIFTTGAPNTSLAPEPGGGNRISFIGNPGQTYTIQFTTSLAPINWQFLATRTADAAGRFDVVNIPPGGTPMRFYRAIFP